MAILGAHHIALRTGQFAAMKAFYTEMLGFPVVGSIPGSDICFIDIGGTTIELLPTAEGESSKPMCGFVHLAFETDDTDATYAELAAKGVQFHVQPRNAGDIRLAFFKDPDGNELEIFHSPTLTWR
ncbi:MAG: VOC family protein [Anaerolineae bacterium]